MAEHLDHFLPVHHLLNVAVDSAQIFLLLRKIDRGLRRNFRGNKGHDADHHQGEKGQGEIQHQHAEKGGQDHDAGVDELGDALADQLAQGVHIVGVDGHDVPMGVGVKIPDRQRLHVPEQLHTQIAHGALADIDHDAVVAVGAQNADAVHDRHGQQRCRQPGEVGGLGPGQRNDVVIDQALHEKRPPQGGQRGPKNADHDQAKGKLIVPEHIAEDALHGGRLLAQVHFF